MIIWLTGYSGAGKTTLASHLTRRMQGQGHAAVLLDGDAMRSVLGNKGFDEASRKMHNTQVGNLALLLEQQDIIVVVALISPYADVRNNIAVQAKQWMEVHVSTPLSVCMQRDTKGLYKQAVEGTITSFTGISAPYEAPINPAMQIDTSLCNIDDAIDQLWKHFITQYQHS